MTLASWALLLPVPAEATVLDAGASPDDVLRSLAHLYRRVITLAEAPHDVAALAQPAPHGLPPNVQRVIGDVGELPLRAGSVDLVFLGGALGRAGRGATGRTGRVRQRRLLDAARAVLRPGGWVVLGVGNRLALRPGAWRDPALRSASGYRRLLASAGYREVRLWCALPDAGQPRFLVPCRQPQFAHFIRRLETARRGALRMAIRAALQRLGLLRYTAESFLVIARSRGTDR